MLITSGAGGLALQVSVLQRTIDFGSGRAFLRPPAITKRFSLQGKAAALTQQRNGIPIISVFST